MSAISTAINHNPNTSEAGTRVFSCIKGDNSDLIFEAGKLYIKPGQSVLDVTYGRGAFWRKYDRSKIHLITSDWDAPADRKADFRNLPDPDCAFDHTIFDPPYIHDGKTFHLISQYRNNVTTATLSHNQIVRLYEQGMAECARVTKYGGFIMVKCQDEVASGCQRLSHFEILLIGLKHQLYCRDLLVLHQASHPLIQVKRQLHCRKNHSYLLVFQKLEKLNAAQRNALEFNLELLLEAVSGIQKTLAEIPVRKAPDKLE